VALLGRSYKEEAPMHMCLDMEPCEDCQEHMEQGVILMGVDPEKTTDEAQPYRTGHFVVVKEEAIERIFEEKISQDIIRRRAAFVEVEVLRSLGAIQ
jgi:hypothetical protein